MYKYIIPALLIVAMAVLLGGCFFAPRDPKPTEGPESFGEPLELKEFSFNHGGMAMDQCFNYILTQEGGSVRLHAELVAGNKTVDATVGEDVMRELGVIAGKYHLDEWDGFNGSNSMVHDGSSFSMYMTLSEGTKVAASGNNEFPKGFGNAYGELCRLFDELVDEYGDLYPKTLESDALDSVMLTVNPKEHGSRQTFSVQAYPEEGRAKIDIEMVLIEEYDLENEYRFYGYCENFPFEEIQNIVRKYDLPAWNGWDKAAEDYNSAEWFQINLGYESGESISAMGTLHPEGYEGFRSEIMSLIIDFVRENGDSFIPWQG